jgi:hypothetical protein
MPPARLALVFLSRGGKVAEIVLLAEFRERINRDVRVRTLSEYPGSSVRTRVVTLPAGHAVESIVDYGARTKYAEQREV